MLHLLNALPDHQKAEDKFKLGIVMAGFQGQIEIFFFFFHFFSGTYRATQLCLMEVCGPHCVIFQEDGGQKMFPKIITYLYLMPISMKMSDS